MSLSFLTNVNLNKNELQNARIQNLSTSPASPVLGQLYYDTDDNNLFVWDGAWTDLTVQGGSVTYATPTATIEAGDAAVQGSATTVLRSDAQFAVSTGAAVAIDGTNAEGSSTTLARANHTHAYGAASITTAAFAAGVRLDTINVPTASVSMNSQKIISLLDPTGAQDAATKAYVDGVSAGLDTKPSVRAATTAAGTLATSFENADVIDGVTLATGNRILIKDQAAPAENGIYTVNASGTPTRVTDLDSWSEVPGAYVWVEEGTVNADTGWVTTANTGGTLGTTSMPWTLFSAATQLDAGAGLLKTGGIFDVVGTANRIVANADSIDIHSSYVGQTSITTLGTITTGTWTGTDIAVADGGTGASTAATARTNLTAAGYYSSATHGAGTSISITAATHGLRASRGLLVQVQNESDGAVELADVVVASNGDVTVTFAVSQSANTKRVTVLG